MKVLTWVLAKVFKGKVCIGSVIPTNDVHKTSTILFICIPLTTVLQPLDEVHVLLGTPCALVVWSGGQDCVGSEVKSNLIS